MIAALPWLCAGALIAWALGVCWLIVEARRAPEACCSLCLVPGEFPELHQTVPGRFCSQCAMAIVEVRARSRIERRPR